MLKPKHLSYFSITIASAGLASAFALEGFIWAIGVALLVGLAWIVSTRWGWQRGSTLSMFCFMLGISGAALQENIYRGLLLTSTIATLAAWDLSSFARLLEIHQNIASKEDLIRIHHRRLSAVIMIGFVLPMVAFALQLELKFWQAFLLGVILLFGLSQVFSQLRRSSF